MRRHYFLYAGAGFLVLGDLVILYPGQDLQAGSRVRMAAEPR